MAQTLLMCLNCKYNNLWAKAVHSVCFAQSRFATKNFKSITTLHEVVHRKKPNLKSLKTLGIAAFMYKWEYKQGGELDSRAEKDILVGN